MDKARLITQGLQIRSPGMRLRLYVCNEYSQTCQLDTMWANNDCCTLAKFAHRYPG